MAACSASRIIASARSKYAGFGVERSPAERNGLIPSKVAPSRLQPVYVVQSRLTQIALKPAFSRSAR